MGLLKHIRCTKIACIHSDQTLKRNKHTHFVELVEIKQNLIVLKVFKRQLSNANKPKKNV